ncbi:hypothetical protein [Singulisphaera sp. PoT]|uniref:hypothetical protein n=1 Tax=Singulisphaera sp. PoT TaxID=3411797 RepID=UPI003BF52F75
MSTLTAFLDEVKDDGEAGLDEPWSSINHSGHDGDPPVEGLITFQEWLRIEAGRIRNRGGSASEWLAGRIDELADEARRLSASCPAEFDDRQLQLEEWTADELRAEGYYSAECSMTPWF